MSTYPDPANNPSYLTYALYFEYLCVEDGLDLIYCTMWHWYRDNNRKYVDEILEILNLEYLRLQYILAFLSITKPTADQIRTRLDYSKRCYEYVKLIEPVEYLVLLSNIL